MLKTTKEKMKALEDEIEELKKANLYLVNRLESEDNFIKVNPIIDELETLVDIAISQKNRLIEIQNIPYKLAMAEIEYLVQGSGVQDTIINIQLASDKMVKKG